jgi:hypothetical protein
MASMLKTLWIIIGAVTFGTLLEEFKLLSKLIDPLNETRKDHRESDWNRPGHGGRTEYLCRG